MTISLISALCLRLYLSLYLGVSVLSFAGVCLCVYTPVGGVHPGEAVDRDGIGTLRPTVAISLTVEVVVARAGSDLI